jgi:hypothetical protein
MIGARWRPALTAEQNSSADHVSHDLPHSKREIPLTLPKHQHHQRRRREIVRRRCGRRSSAQMFSPGRGRSPRKSSSPCIDTRSYSCGHALADAIVIQPVDVTSCSTPGFHWRSPHRPVFNLATSAESCATTPLYENRNVASKAPGTRGDGLVDSYLPRSTAVMIGVRQSASPYCVKARPHSRSKIANRLRDPLGLPSRSCT